MIDCTGDGNRLLRLLVLFFVLRLCFVYFHVMLI